MMMKSERQKNETESKRKQASPGENKHEKRIKTEGSDGQLADYHNNTTSATATM
jgi:hypothetical protein